MGNGGQTRGKRGGGLRMKKGAKGVGKPGRGAKADVTKRGPKLNRKEGQSGRGQRSQNGWKKGVKVNVEKRASGWRKGPKWLEKSELKGTA
jgi:hypothetical protein